MAEENTGLAQRVEALEQISHARVVERIGQIEQRVSRIESAREAEEPHVATKADVARLETVVVETRSDLQEQIAEFRAESQEQNATTRSDLQEQIAEFRAESQAQIAEFRAEAQVQNATTRSDLQEQIAEFRAESQAQIAEFRAEAQVQNATTRSDLQVQIAETKSTLEDRIGALEVANEKQYRQFLMWLIGTAVTTTGVIIAAVSAIVG